MESATVVAKVRVDSEKRNHWGGAQQREIAMSCVHDSSIPEDKKFSQATPSGRIELTVNNPGAIERLIPDGQLGQEFYVYFVPVPKA